MPLIPSQRRYERATRPYTVGAVVVLALALIAILASLSASKAQEPPGVTASCVDRALVVARLAERYGETQRSMGLLNRDAGVVEMYASDTTGTWTIIVTRPDNRSCLLAAGQMWSPTETPIPGDDT